MKKSILVVEDNERLLSNLLFTLTEKGFDAIGAENGRQALASVESKMPDLIISDIDMPDMNGYELLAQLRKSSDTLTVPVIFLTGRKTPEDIRVGMHYGADDYVTKPFNIKDLLKTIEARLARYDQQQQRLADHIKRAQQHLTAVLPHELRTPVSGILGASSLIRSELATLSKEEIGQLNDCVISSARRLARIVENFLLYSQVHALLDNLNGKPLIDDNATTSAGAELHDIAMQIAENCYRSPDIRISLEDATLAANQWHVEKALAEICLNAFSFSPSGSAVSIVSRIKGELYIIDVTDHGRGMTNEQIRLITEPASAFMQFDRQYFEQQGTGLGLTLVRSIVTLYGGFLHIASEYGVQTTVSICFPLQQP
jgi:DNA-binding response OmpR family regulator